MNDVVAETRRHKATRQDFTWTPQRDTAASLLAMDSMTDAEIAASVQVGTRTLGDWKLLPDFITRVEENREKLRAETEADRNRIRTTGYAIIEERVKRKSERLLQLEEIRLARAALASTDVDWIAQGGETGLVIAKQRAVGSGQSTMFVTDYTIDTSLITTEMALDEALAKELGQYLDKPNNSQQNEPVRIIFEERTVATFAGDSDRSSTGSGLDFCSAKSTSGAD